MRGYICNKERVPKIKTTKFFHISKNILPTFCLSMDKNKLGRIFSCLPYLPYHHIWKSLYLYISMDFPIYLSTTRVYVQTFFLEKVWLEDTLPTYSLNICPKFRSFFLLDPLLRQHLKFI